MDNNLWALVQQVGVVLLVPIAGAIGTLLVQRIKLQSLKIKGDTWEKTKMIAEISVKSAEQGARKGRVTDKKTHAFTLAKKMLGDKKIKIDDDILSELIESEVWGNITSNGVVKDVFVPGDKNLSLEVEEVVPRDIKNEFKEFIKSSPGLVETLDWIDNNVPEDYLTKEAGSVPAG